jgi:hypothetical protein
MIMKWNFIAKYVAGLHLPWIMTAGQLVVESVMSRSRPMPITHQEGTATCSPGYSRTHSNPLWIPMHANANFVCGLFWTLALLTSVDCRIQFFYLN